MQTTNIAAKILAHSLSPQKEEIISAELTLPRIILAELNTHRMLAKNTSSSRAIPFRKMIEVVNKDPFIPTAWQKHHSGMQGSSYYEDESDVDVLRHKWLLARDKAVESAINLASGVFPPDEIFEWDDEGNLILIGDAQIQVTKQLCNRLLEPFMWVKAVVTGNKESWNNFFALRCPYYQDERTVIADGKAVFYKSKEDYKKSANTFEYEDFEDFDWYSINKGQAEIHIMELAEKAYDAIKASTPNKLLPGEWHIPFHNKMNGNKINDAVGRKGEVFQDGEYRRSYDLVSVKVSTAMTARASYTVVGNETEMSYEKMIDLADSLVTRPYTMLNGTVIEEWEPVHSSPTDHCARAMSNEEYYSYVRGQVKQESGYRLNEINPKSIFGWCRQFKGFIPYRHIIETGISFSLEK